MTSLVASVVQNQKSVFYVFILGLLCYFLMMDAVLYVTFKSINLIDEKPTDGQSWSPFHPLSVKLLMSDHCGHYIITPISEHFNSITKFSDVFYFITPNMISFTHLAIGLIAARLVNSESLKSRRIAVILFEWRAFLDAFDGTIYRSRAKNKSYASNHSNIGFWIDSTSDTLAGIAFCFGIIFYLWKCLPSADNSPPSQLPWKNDAENGVLASEHHVVEKTKLTATDCKLSVFWRVFCYGAAIAVASAMWDQLLEQYSTVFMTRLEPDFTLLQSRAQHSNATWIIFWLWRVLSGQALLQPLLVAVFVDRIWEFARFTQYFLFAAVCILSAITWLHVHSIRATLGLTS